MLGSFLCNLGDSIFDKGLVTINFSNKRALIRVDFNVPLDENYNITDDTRIRVAIPTIQSIINNDGSVILMSHRGRPKGIQESLSMKYLVSHIGKLLSRKVKFVISNVQQHAESNL